MITGELKSKVDRIWDTMWSGGISNPLAVIEQLTYLLFIKRLDEIHTLQENKANRTGKAIEEPIFTSAQDGLRWSRFKDRAPEPMFETVRDQVFPFIKTLGQSDEGEGGSTYSHHMKDALFMMPTARVLANVVDQLDRIDMADSDTKGDLYEYMLGKIASAGQNGQFRTPRHIIQLMVDMTAPTPKDTICDPACGTAGFLVAASEHLRNHHGDAIYKDAEARRRFNESTFHGYDFDNTMLRIGSMNMLLHGVENPDIRYKDSLAEADDDDAEKYSLILANPPFAGSLDYESTAKDLHQIVKTKKTELLFLALFLRLLQTGGRAAVIVPDGVLFGSSNAHKALRKILVEEQKLDAVISMPSGVFKPYAGAPGETMAPQFLHQYMVSDHFQLQISQTTKGANQGLLNLGDLKRLSVPVPPIHEQRHFAAIVESVERQKAHQRAHLSELDNLFASLQHRAFNGELSPHDLEGVFLLDTGAARTAQPHSKKKSARV